MTDVWEEGREKKSAIPVQESRLGSKHEQNNAGREEKNRRSREGGKKAVFFVEKKQQRRILISTQGSNETGAKKGAHRE